MTTIIIPARMGSTRLPGKPLAERQGKPLVWWTWQQASRVPGAKVHVATCDDEIEHVLADFGVRVVRTSEGCQSGTHRVAEAAAWLGLPSKETIINWQVDEPFIQPTWISEMLDLLQEQLQADMTTLVTQLPSNQAHNPHLTKAVVSAYGRCHWFSRSPMLGSQAHLGIYACSMQKLQQIGWLDRTSLSIVEGLEQLTWLEQGFTVYAHTVKGPLPQAINTPEDLVAWQENTASRSLPTATRDY